MIEGAGMEVCAQAKTHEAIERSAFNADNGLTSRCADEGVVGGSRKKRKDEFEKCRAKALVVEQKGYQKGCR